MTSEILLDTDILMKTVSYGLASTALAYFAERGVAARTLGAAPFMLAARIRRAERIADAASAARELARVMVMMEVVEPTAEEMALAAEIEALAQSDGLAVHGGESQLLAMLVKRDATILLTGDKQAVKAAVRLPMPLPSHRIACLEQLFASLIELVGAEVIRTAVCAEPRVERTLTYACSCSSSNPVDPRHGLASYLADLRREAPALLCLGTKLPF